MEPLDSTELDISEKLEEETEVLDIEELDAASEELETAMEPLDSTELDISEKLEEETKELERETSPSFPAHAGSFSQAATAALIRSA